MNMEISVTISVDTYTISAAITYLFIGSQSSKLNDFLSPMGIFPWQRRIPAYTFLPMSH
jgi:hypothetical protein